MRRLVINRWPAGKAARCLDIGLLLFLVLAAGCADTGQPTIPVSTYDSRTLVYSGVVLEFVEPGVGSQEVALDGAGDGMAEGARMMAVAPLECFRGADPYTAAFCIGLAPFFPFLSAARVQDQEISLQQIDALYGHLESLNVYQQFREEVERQADAASLQVAEHPADDTARLRAWLGPISLLHDGYKGGYIQVDIPYRFELIAPGGEVLTTISDQDGGKFDVDTWQDETEPDRSIARWMKHSVAEGLRRTLVEWQPEIVLAPRHPAPVKKRSIIGVMQERWPTEASVRPRLEWQPLHEILDPELLKQVSDISYELRITGRYSDETYYFVSDLAEPSHELEIDLTPCAYYIWQPRARFRYRNMYYRTSLRIRQWSPGVWIPDHYSLYTPGPDCKNPVRF